MGLSKDINQLSYTKILWLLISQGILVELFVTPIGFLFFYLTTNLNQTEIHEIIKLISDPDIRNILAGWGTPWLIGAFSFIAVKVKPYVAIIFHMK